MENKLIRKAVRVFLIEEDKVVVIKYNFGEFKEGYYDIPGGKIELGEDFFEASKREFKEETGIEISELKQVGNLIIEYPDRIYDMDILIAGKHEGFPKGFEENNSMWIGISKINDEIKTYPSLELLKPGYINYLSTNNNKFEIHINVNEKHEILNTNVL